MNECLKRFCRKSAHLFVGLFLVSLALRASAQEPPQEAKKEPADLQVFVPKLATYWADLERKFSTDDLDKIAQVARRLEELDAKVSDAYLDQRRIWKEYEEARKKYYEQERSYSDQLYRLSEQESAAGGKVEPILDTYGEKTDPVAAEKLPKDKVIVLPGGKYFYFDVAQWEAKARADIEKSYAQQPEEKQRLLKEISDTAAQFRTESSNLKAAISQQKSIYDTLKALRPEDPASRPVRYQYNGYEDFLFIRAKPDVVLLDRTGPISLHAELVLMPTPDPTPPPPGAPRFPKPYATPSPTPAVEWSLWQDGKKVFAHKDKVGEWYPIAFSRLEEPKADKPRFTESAPDTGRPRLEMPAGSYALYVEVRGIRGQTLVDQREFIYVGGGAPVQVPAEYAADTEIMDELKRLETEYGEARRAEAQAVEQMHEKWARLSSDLSAIPEVNAAEQTRKDAHARVRSILQDFYTYVARVQSPAEQKGEAAALYGLEAQSKRINALRHARIAAKYHLRAAQDRARIKLRPSRIQFATPEELSAFGPNISALLKTKPAPPLPPEAGDEPSPPSRWRDGSIEAPTLNDAQIAELRSAGLIGKPYVDDVVGVSAWDRMEDQRWAREELELALIGSGILGVSRQAFLQLKQFQIMEEEIAKLGPKPLTGNQRLLEAKAEVVRNLAQLGTGALYKYEASAEDLLEQQKSYFAAVKDLGKGFVDAWKNEHQYEIQDASEFFFLFAKTPYAFFDVAVGCGSDMAICVAQWLGADWKTRDERVQVRIDKLREETAEKVDFLHMLTECDSRQLVALNQWHKGRRDIFNQTGIRLPPSERGLGYNMLIRDRRFAEMTNGGLTRILGAIDMDPKEIRANELRIAEDMTRLTRIAAQAAQRSFLGRDPETGDFVWSSLLKPATAISTQYRVLFELENVGLRSQYIDLKVDEEKIIEAIRLAYYNVNYGPEPDVLEATNPVLFPFHEQLLSANADYLLAWLNIENCEFMREICYLTGMIRAIDAKKPATPGDEALKKRYEDKIRLCQEASRVNISQAEPLVLKLRYRDAILGYDYYKALSLLDQMRRQDYLGRLAKIKDLKIDQETLERAKFDDKIFDAIKESTKQYDDLQKNDAVYEELKRGVQWEITVDLGTDVFQNWGNIGFYAAGFNAFFGWMGVPAGGTGPASFIEYLYGVVNPFSGAASSWAGLGQVMGNIVEEAAEEVVSEAFKANVSENQNWADFMSMLAVESAQALWRKGMSRMETKGDEVEQQVKPEAKLRSVEQLAGAAWETVKSVRDHPFYKALSSYLKAASALASAGTEAEQARQRLAMDDASKVMWDHLAVWEAVRKRWSLENVLSETEYVKGVAQAYRSAANFWAAKVWKRIRPEFDHERWVGEIIKREVDLFNRKLQERGGQTSVELASELLRKIDPGEVKRLKGMEYKGEVFLDPVAEKVLAEQVRFLVTEAMKETSKKFPGELIAFAVEGSSADPDSPEYNPGTSDNDVTALVATMARRAEVKEFFDSYLRDKLVVEPSRWQIECFADPMPNLDTTAEGWDMKAANDFLIETMRGFAQAERYITVGQLRFQKLIGKLRARVFIAGPDGTLTIAPKDADSVTRLYGNVNLQTGDGLDIVLDQEHFIRKYEQAYADNPRALIYALAKHNIREMAGAMASTEQGKNLLNSLTEEQAKQLGGPHYAIVDAAQNAEGLTQEQKKLAVRWLKLKSGMPLDEVYQQTLTMRLNKLEAEHKEQDRPFDREEWKEPVLQVIIAEDLEVGKQLRRRFLEKAVAGRRQYELEFKNQATRAQATVDGGRASPEDVQQAKAQIMQFTQESDQRSFALAVMMRRLSADQIAVLQSSQLKKGNPPDFLPVDATILLSKSISFESAPSAPEPGEPHVDVDTVSMAKLPPPLPEPQDIEKTVPGKKPPLDPAVVLKQMVERERCPHW